MFIHVFSQITDTALTIAFLFEKLILFFLNNIAVEIVAWQIFLTKNIILSHLVQKMSAFCANNAIVHHMLKFYNIYIEINDTVLIFSLYFAKIVSLLPNQRRIYRRGADKLITILNGKTLREEG